jgi:hypothetical protein
MMDIAGDEGVSDKYGVFLGLDVGKTDRHAVALDLAGKRLHDAALPNIEAGLRKLFDKLVPARPNLGRSRPARFDWYPARRGRPDCWASDRRTARFGHAPSANLHPGTAKTDARDAYVIADAAKLIATGPPSYWCPRPSTEQGSSGDSWMPQTTKHRRPRDPTVAQMTH